jgi:hypothetical protein
MSEEKEKYLGESLLSQQPKKKMSLVLKDKTVTAQKLADKAVTPQKVSDDFVNKIVKPSVDRAKADLQNQIDSLVVSGQAISNELGDNPNIAISQKTLTEKLNEIYEALANDEDLENIDVLYFTDYLEEKPEGGINYSTLNCINEGGDITYIVEDNVFALHLGDTYYLNWSKTSVRESSTEYNKIIDGDIYVMRDDKLYYFVVASTNEDLHIDNALDPESDNPISNKAVWKEFNDRAPLIGEVTLTDASGNNSYTGTCSITISEVLNAFKAGRQVFLTEKEYYNKTILITQSSDNSYSAATGIAISNGIIYEIVFAADLGPNYIIMYERNTGVAVDSTLSSVSENPVKNSVITKAIGDLRSYVNGTVSPRIDALEAIQHGSSLLPFDGTFSTPSNQFVPSATPYEAEGGKLMLHTLSGKMLLRVVENNKFVYYTTWTANDNRRASSAYSNLNDVFLWEVTDNEPHIYTFNSSLKRLVEVAGESGLSNAILKIDGIIKADRDPFIDETTEFTDTGGSVYYSELRKTFVIGFEGDYYTIWDTEDKGTSEDYQNAELIYTYTNNALNIYKATPSGLVSIGSQEVDQTITSDSDNPVASSAIYDALATKQDVLQSGINIKTINQQPLLGEGNITLESPSVITVAYEGSSPTDKPGIWNAGSLYYDNVNWKLYVQTVNGQFNGASVPLRNGCLYLVLTPVRRLYYYNSSLSNKLEPVLVVDNALNNNSVNPVENKAIGQEINYIKENYALLDALEEWKIKLNTVWEELFPTPDITPSDDDTDPGEPNVFSNIFDPEKANNGELNIDTTIDGAHVSLEENVDKITPELVRAAWDKLDVTPIADGLTVVTDLNNIPSSGKYIVTAEAAGFDPGTSIDAASTKDATKTVGGYNAALLTSIASKTGTYANCAGVKLDQVYLITPTGYRITLEKDFSIDGEVDGERVGGLTTKKGFFDTTHSLNLNKANFTWTVANSYVFFNINYTEGIEQLLVTGCSFYKPTDSYALFNIPLSSVSPFENSNTWVLNSKYCIDYMLFADNEYTGVYFIKTDSIRINKAALIIGNTFNHTYSHPLHFGIQNCEDDDDPAKVEEAQNRLKRGYTCCPIWIVDNEFNGRDGILRPTSSGSYYASVLAEGHAVYMLHNDINNYISGYGSTTTPTYDAYISTVVACFCNNKVSNLLKLVNTRGTFGTCKAKSSGIPKGLSAYKRPFRIYVGNEYSIDEDYISGLWANRTSADINLDRGVSLENVLALHLGYSTHDLCSKIIFNDNKIYYPRIDGCAAGNPLSADVIEINNNVFTASKNNDLPMKFNWFTDPESECPFIFNCHSGRKDGNKIEVSNNNFNIEDNPVHLLVVRSGTSSSHPPYTNNIIVGGNTVYNNNALLGLYAGKQYIVFPNRNSDQVIALPSLPKFATPGYYISSNNCLYKCIEGEYSMPKIYLTADYTPHSVVERNNMKANGQGVYTKYSFSSPGMDYTLRITSEESVTVHLQGVYDGIDAIQEAFGKALFDAGYYMYEAGFSYYDLKDSNGNQIYKNDGKTKEQYPFGKVISAMPKATSGFITYGKHSIGNKNLYVSCGFGSFGVTNWFSTENRKDIAWELEEGTVPLEEFDTVETYQELPVNAEQGDIIHVTGSDEYYKCVTAGTPCIMNFAFRSKNEDGSSAGGTTFDDETFSVPLNSMETIQFTLDGTYESISEIATVFYNQVLSEGYRYDYDISGSAGNVVRENNTSYGISYVQFKAKNNGKAPWHMNGNPYKYTNLNPYYDEENTIYKQIILNAVSPKINIQAHPNSSKQQGKVDLGSDPVWEKITREEAYRQKYNPHDDSVDPNDDYIYGEDDDTDNENIN